MAKKHKTPRDIWLPNVLKEHLQNKGMSQTELAEKLAANHEGSLISTKKRCIQRLLNNDAPFTNKICREINKVLRCGWNDPDQLVEQARAHAAAETQVELTQFKDEMAKLNADYAALNSRFDEFSDSKKTELLASYNQRDLQDTLESLSQQLDIVTTENETHYNEVRATVDAVKCTLAHLSDTMDSLVNRVDSLEKQGEKQLSVVDTAAVLKPFIFAWISGGWVNNPDVCESLLLMRKELNMNRKDFRVLIKNRYFSKCADSDSALTVEHNWRSKTPFEVSFVALVAVIAFFTGHTFFLNVDLIDVTGAFVASMAAVKFIVWFGWRFDRLDEVVERWSAPVAEYLAIEQAPAFTARPMKRPPENNGVSVLCVAMRMFTTEK